jgi:hypothetical protein
MKDYLLKSSDPGTPFSGSAQHGGTRSQRRNNRNKGSTKGNKQTAQANPRTQARTPRWSPHGSTLLVATPAPALATTTDYAPYVAEIKRLHAMLTAQAQSPYQDAQFGMPVPSQPATVFSASRPREFYCWLHGWNNTHHGSTCKIMDRKIPEATPKKWVYRYIYHTILLFLDHCLFLCLVCFVSSHHHCFPLSTCTQHPSLAWIHKEIRP